MKRTGSFVPVSELVGTESTPFAISLATATTSSAGVWGTVGDLQPIAAKKKNVKTCISRMLEIKRSTECTLEVNCQRFPNLRCWHNSVLVNNFALLSDFTDFGEKPSLGGVCNAGGLQ